MYTCTRKPIHNISDLKIAIRCEPKIPAHWPEQVKACIRKIKHAVGEDVIIGCWSHHGPYNNASLLIDPEVLYALFKLDYPYYVKLKTFAMERISPYTRAIDDAGVNIHCVGGIVPNTLVGNRNYDKFIQPFEKKYIEYIHRMVRRQCITTVVT